MSHLLFYNTHIQIKLLVNYCEDIVFAYVQKYYKYQP